MKLQNALIRSPQCCSFSRTQRDPFRYATPSSSFIGVANVDVTLPEESRFTISSVPPAPVPSEMAQKPVPESGPSPRSWGVPLTVKSAANSGTSGTPVGAVTTGGDGML